MGSRLPPETPHHFKVTDKEGNWKIITPEQITKLRRLVVGMIGAASAYEQYACGWKEGRKNVDPFKSTRIKDFQAAAEAGKELLQELEG